VLARAPVSKSGLSFGAACALLLLAAPARADVSSWLFTGVGPSWDKSREQVQLTFQLDAGMGTDPSNAFVIGGLGRLQTHFGLGSDTALLLRGATRGYVNGDWGFALDLGPYVRLTENQQGFTGSLAIGAPWGITLSAFGTSDLGSNFLTGAVLGIDLARLTVYRRSGSSWWRNTFPAYRPEEE
jgi:hypothetical protein